MRESGNLVRTNLGRAALIRRFKSIATTRSRDARRIELGLISRDRRLAAAQLKRTRIDVQVRCADRVESGSARRTLADVAISLNGVIHAFKPGESNDHDRRRSHIRRDGHDPL